MNPNVIETTDIAKAYVMGQEVINALVSVSISIKRGEYVAFMGPSGSGKSTLMNIVGCLDTPSHGQYILNGQDVSRMSDNQLAEVRNKEIGFVFQSFNLLPRASALDNVALPLIYAGLNKRERTERALESLRAVGLADRASHRPNELSGGQRQRVAIARALVNNPSVLLADEPTGNLDPDVSASIMQLFGEINNAGTAILMATHNFQLIEQYPHRVLTCKDGELLDSARTTLPG